MKYNISNNFFKIPELVLIYLVQSGFVSINQNCIILCIKIANHDQHKKNLTNKQFCTYQEIEDITPEMSRTLTASYIKTNKFSSKYHYILTNKQKKT